jgi:hypothetical protein
MARAGQAVQQRIQRCRIAPQRQYTGPSRSDNMAKAGTKTAARTSDQNDLPVQLFFHQQSFLDTAACFICSI